MFEFFKKKKGPFDAAIKLATELLQIQVSLWGAQNNHEFKRRLMDLYSRGYILGLCDAVSQSAGVKDDGERMALLTTVHDILFGEERGTAIAEQSLRDLEEPTFVKGRMRGGQELVEFARNKTPPLGLTAYLQTGEI